MNYAKSFEVIFPHSISEERMESNRGDGGLGFVEIETAVIGGLDASIIFHIVKEIIGFVLYMHQQIPSTLQRLEVEFGTLRKECKDLESVQADTELTAASRRKHNVRIREAKQGIRKLEKLMDAVSSLLSVVQLALNEAPDIQEIILILGGSVLRPRYVYEVLFSPGRVVPESEKNGVKSRVAEVLSRKVIRALLSHGAGGGSCPGPMKLFILVKAAATSNLSFHFLPKRDFKYSKKVVPFRFHIKCKIQERHMDESHNTSQVADSGSFLDCASNDTIWFQCKQTIKGLASKSSPTE